MLYLSEDLKYLTNENVQKLLSDSLKLSRKIGKLASYLGKTSQ